MHLHVEAMPDDPGTAGVSLRAAGAGGRPWRRRPHGSTHRRTESARRGAGVEQHGSPLGPVNRTPPIPDVEIPTFRAAAANPESWIKAADQPRTFRTVGQKKDVTLVPLNRLFDRRYSVYWRVS